MRHGAVAVALLLASGSGHGWDLAGRLPLACALPCGYWSAGLSWARLRLCAAVVLPDCGSPATADGAAEGTAILQKYNLPVAAVRLDAALVDPASPLAAAVGSALLQSPPKPGANATRPVALSDPRTNTSRVVPDWRNASARLAWFAAAHAARKPHAGAALWASAGAALVDVTQPEARTVACPRRADLANAPLGPECRPTSLAAADAAAWRSALQAMVDSLDPPVAREHAGGAMRVVPFKASPEHLRGLAAAREGLGSVLAESASCSESELAGFLLHGRGERDLMLCETAAAALLIAGLVPVQSAVQPINISAARISFDPKTSRGTVTLQAPAPLRQIGVMLRGGEAAQAAGAQRAALRGAVMPRIQLRGNASLTQSELNLRLREEYMRRHRHRRHAGSGYDTLMIVWLVLLWARLRATQPVSEWEEEPEEPKDAPFTRKAWQRYQVCIDRLQPRLGMRYLILGSLAVMYILRITRIHGFYVVTYALGIYLLKLFILFLRPAVDLDSDDESPQLLHEAAEHEGHHGEYRPFMRRMPEFKAWHNACKAFCVAYVCTFVPIFDIPVFWPILVMYFVVLFAITIKKQVGHMWKHKYVPWSTGRKVAYAGGRGVPAPAARGKLKD
eukprot:TRINITY_DN12609_c0_g1_i1.p1 TRINITY_DN12609_c0_g1~~TRINITY_DN12609_c0_g1_i1.p1  ORF type:complete len:621 (+),score=116.98 TRINITY_DN12609_c0_g1_i1:69-1931(+)